MCMERSCGHAPAPESTRPHTNWRGAQALLASDRVANPDPDGDEALMLAYAGGDAHAFDRLYARHRGGSYRYFLRSLSDAGVAQELFQDLWMSVIRAREAYQPQAKFSTWLYTMAHNRLIDHYRRSNVVRLVAFDDPDDEESAIPDPAPGPEEHAAARHAARQLLELVAQLPAAQREAFLLQAEGGLSLSEIAVATGAGEETVKSRLRYAMARLRQGMKDFA